MKTRTRIALTTLLVLTLASAAFAQSDAKPVEAATPHTIVATYFHGDVRCATCKKIEAYSREAVEKTFAAEIAAGRVVFRAVNTDREENAHFVKDYSLVTKSLVLTEESDGKVVRWVNLDRIWQLVGNKDTFVDYVADGVRAYLGSAS